MRLALGLWFAMLFPGSPVRAADHIWTMKGTVVYLVVGDEGVDTIGPFRVYSPDHSKHVEVSFSHGKGDGDAIPSASLYFGVKKLDLSLDPEWNQVEVLWSPDSQTVALTGGFNAYTNSTRIFDVRNEAVKPIDIGPLQADMAQTYPPCAGQNAEEEICHAEENGDKFNYATVAWANATTAVIMAEIPCSSSQGGMMCQVEGYEIDVRTCHILRRMTAGELKRSWQSKLAWNLRIPEPPHLKPAK